MKIADIKKKMHAWTDSMGFDISDDIDGAKTKVELLDILKRHTRWIEGACDEAKDSTREFAGELGLE